VNVPEILLEAPEAGLEAPRLRARTSTVPYGLCASLAAAVTALCGYFALFGTFQFYDDEGYFLVSLASYRAGHALYDEVFTQYGPLYYQVHSFVFSLLGLPFTHAAARITVLVTWTCTSLLCGLAAFRLTRDALLGIAAQVLTFAVLAVLVDEPLHPGGLACLILAASAVLVTRSGQSSWTFPLLGVLAGSLLAIKVNVGAFAVLSLATVLLASVPRTRVFRFCLTGFCALLPVVSLVLMRDLLSESAVAHYALLVTLSFVPLSMEVLRSQPSTVLPVADLVRGLAAVAVVPVASFALALASGTTVRGFLDGVILAPMRLPTVFCVLMDVPSLPFLWAAASLALYVYCLLAHRGGPEAERGSELILAGARLTVSVVAVASFAGLLPLKPMYFALPFLWVFLRPGGPDEIPRLFLVFTAGLQSLHAFPVAGSQVAFATFLMVPLAALGFRDGIATFLESRRGLQLAGVRRAATAAFCALALLAGLYRDFPVRLRAYRETGRELGLAGTSGMRLPEWEATLYRWLVTNLKVHSDGFVTLPGLNSLYLWTEISPPTLLNATVWMSLLDVGAQNRVVAALESRRNACAVVQALTAPLWRPRVDPDSMPLVRYIFENFQPAGSAMGYDFLVRKDRNVVLQGCARIVDVGPPAEAATSSAAGPVLEIRPPPSTDGRFERVVIVDCLRSEAVLDLPVPGEGETPAGTDRTITVRLPPRPTPGGPAS